MFYSHFAMHIVHAYFDITEIVPMPVSRADSIITFTGKEYICLFVNKCLELDGYERVTASASLHVGSTTV